MDLLTKNFNIDQTQSPPPPPSLLLKPSTSHSDASFPIIAIAVIGILATAFLLVSYYVFVIKCCLNWHRIDLLGRFSFSRRHREDLATAAYSPSAAVHRRGLDESVIRAIPIFQFNKGFVKTELSECAVCLSDFQEEEKLRSIPNCGHVFHIDCIDVWLQSNANCPLCRRSISVPPRFGFAFEQNRIVAPATSPQDPDPYRTRSNQGSEHEDYVVIELGEVNRDPENPFGESVFWRRERLGSVDLPSSLLSISISPFRVKRKKSRKLDHVLSMGDECIDVNRVKDERFSAIQPIRRSFSLDSSNDPLLFQSIQEIVKQKSNGLLCSSAAAEGCSGSSSRVRRSLFSFGHGKGSRSSVLPINLDP